MRLLQRHGARINAWPRPSSEVCFLPALCGSPLLECAALEVRRRQATAVQRAGHVREVAAQRLQLRQRLLARHPGEPLGGETLHHLGGGGGKPSVEGQSPGQG